MPSLRDRNRLAVIDALRVEGPLSRAALARHTGLSRTTASAVVGELLDQGVLAEQPEPDRDLAAVPQAGRPGIRIALAARAGAALAVDFGHSHVRVAVADLSGEVLAERERSVRVGASASQAIDAAAELTDQVLADAGVDKDRLVGAAMGLPGPIDRRTGVVGSSVILPGWVGVHPATALGERLGVPIAVENDANLGALAEARFGAARGAADVVYVKVSTGIGAGLLIGGRLHRGAAGLAGELGHVPVDPNGALCPCGGRGCLQTVAAWPALEQVLRASGSDLDADACLASARAGESGPRRLLVDAGRAIGRPLADLCNVLNPERVVIGGRLGGPGTPLLDGITESLERGALPSALESLELVGGTLGRRAEALGAIALTLSDTAAISSAGLARAA